MCTGTLEQKIQGDLLTFQSNALILPRASFDATLPVNALHLFAGSYGGWSRALEWLCKKVADCHIGTQVHVDADATTMAIWAKLHEQSLHSGATPATCTWDPSVHVGVCTPVADKSVLNRSRFPTNAIATVSPPCVSWSKGGKLFGLDSEPGFAFFESLQLLEVYQPILLFLECADDTPQHKHFSIIKTILQLLGFEQVWDQIVPLHMLTHNVRTRWLAIWRRHDFHGPPILGTFVPRAPPLTHWHSDLNRHWVPSHVRAQLVLSDEAIQRYGDPQLLPPAKRIKGQTSSSHEVLLQRVAPHNQALPTLCSSYSAQHLLDFNHLVNKGIFASLELCGDDIVFLCPLTFVSLFGTTDRIVLPCNINEAFHSLGNAIAQPHALLALSLGLGTLWNFSSSPIQLTQEAWSHRLTTLNAIVSADKDWITLQSLDSFIASLAFRFFTLPDPAIKYQSVKLTLAQTNQTRSTSIPADATLCAAIKIILNVDDFNEEDLTFMSPTAALLQEESVEACLLPDSSIQCFWRKRSFAWLHYDPVKWPETVEPFEEPISPTLPYQPEAQTTTVIVCNHIEFHLILADADFTKAITFLEEALKVANRDDSRRHPLVGTTIQCYTGDVISIEKLSSGDVVAAGHPT